MQVLEKEGGGKPSGFLELVVEPLAVATVVAYVCVGGWKIVSSGGSEKSEREPGTKAVREEEQTKLGALIKSVALVVEGRGELEGEKEQTASCTCSEGE